MVVSTESLFCMPFLLQEADALLGDNRPDPDAGTRGQQKKLDEINSPPPKRAKKSGVNSLQPASSIRKTLEEGRFTVPFTKLMLVLFKYSAKVMRVGGFWLF